MGLFRFLRKKNPESENKVLVVEPLPLKFSNEDLTHSFKSKSDSIDTGSDVISNDVIAAITAAVNIYMENGLSGSICPLLRRTADKQWRTNGVLQTMHSRKQIN